MTDERYPRCWHIAPPAGRQWALIYTGLEYAVAQWDPVLRSWSHPHADDDTPWHPLPPIGVPSRYTTERTHALWREDDA